MCMYIIIRVCMYVGVYVYVLIRGSVCICVPKLGMFYSLLVV